MAATTVKVGTEETTHITNYGVTEDSSPLDPNDSTGGYGSMSFDMAEMPDDMLLFGKHVDLEDGTRGTTEGYVTSVTGNNGDISVTADSRLSLLMADRQAKPFTGTLGDALKYYFGLAGITERIVIDPEIAARQVTYKGYKGELWTYLNKMICPAQSIEISLVSDNIVVRKVRTREVVSGADTDRGWAVSEGELARSVEVNWYDTKYKANQMVYPKSGWDDSLTVLQVEAGEIVDDITLDVDVSLESIQQPIVVDYVARNYTGPVSVYCVAGSDGIGIKAAQWTAQGGSLTVKIGEDMESIEVVLQGANGKDYSPYRIAATAGSSSNYSSLRLIGTGVHFSQEMITILTGVAEDKTAVVVGATVDNPAITTLGAAYTAGIRTAGSYAGPSQTITATTRDINRFGDSGNVRYPTFGEFDAMYPTETFGEFDALWAGKTFGDFRDEMYDKVRQDFDNQAFGNVAGARERYKDAYYRVRSATFAPDLISYNAEADTTFADFNAVWAGKTIADFNKQWAGKTFGDFDLMPLRKS